MRNCCTWEAASHPSVNLLNIQVVTPPPGQYKDLRRVFWRTSHPERAKSLQFTDGVSGFLINKTSQNVDRFGGRVTGSAQNQSQGSQNQGDFGDRPNAPGFWRVSDGFFREPGSGFIKGIHYCRVRGLCGLHISLNLTS